MTILPPNATTFQRDLEQVIGPAQVNFDSIEQIPGIKYNPPDFMLPWLIWEYGLEHLLPYLSDPRLAIQEGVRWQRIRGTPESLDMALGWLGLENTKVEPEVPGVHFFEYQIDPGRIVQSVDLDNIRALARFSAPLRARLSRLYHGYDVRRLVLDESDYGALLSDYSGIKRDGLVLSFGRKQTAYQSSLEVQVSATQMPLRTARVQDIYWPMLDAQPVGGIVNTSDRISQRCGTAVLAQQSWLGKWDDRGWSIDDATLIGGSLAPTHGIEFTEQDIEVRATLANERSVVFDSELAQSVSSRFSQRGIYVRGEFWGGYWDQRSWSSPGFPLIGDSLTSTYTDQTLISEIIVNIDIGMVLTSNHSVELAESIGAHLAGTALMGSALIEERSAGISIENQFWGGYWDNRSWGDLGFPLIGSAVVLTPDSYVPTRAITVDVGVGSALGSAHSIGFAGQSFDLAGSVHYAQRSIGVSIQGQNWRGDWDERIWNDVDYVFVDFKHSSTH